MPFFLVIINSNFISTSYHYLYFNKITFPLLDPYVKVSLMCEGRRLKKRKTTTKKNTLNPVYNEAIIFDIPPENVEQVSLSIAVMDYDRYVYLCTHWWTVMFSYMQTIFHCSGFNVHWKRKTLFIQNSFIPCYISFFLLQKKSLLSWRMGHLGLVKEWVHRRSMEHIIESTVWSLLTVATEIKIHWVCFPNWAGIWIVWFLS